MTVDNLGIPEVVKQRAATREEQNRQDMLALHGIGAVAIQNDDALLHSAAYKLTQALLKRDLSLIGTLTEEELARLDAFQGNSQFLTGESSDVLAIAELQPGREQDGEESVEGLRAALYEKYPPVKVLLEDHGDEVDGFIALKDVVGLFESKQGSVTSVASVILMLNNTLGELKEQGLVIEKVRLPIKGNPSAIRKEDMVRLLAYFDQNKQGTKGRGYVLRTVLNEGDLGRVKKN
ncbi:MAG: hypothetical protein ACD_52C00212G0002 [uncultured bacterium]|nr:MAG: hypothetical protein ACD_52C00212G0002 [uncultured bacterium]